MSTTHTEASPVGVVARAEKRLAGHIARRGIDDEALAIFATYERMYAAALPTSGRVEDDLMALCTATLPGGA